jgi:hypothetical protein
MKFFCDCCKEMFTAAQDMIMVDGFGFVCEFCELAATPCGGKCKECTCGK